MNRRHLLKTTAITALATPFISRRGMADTLNADLLNTTLTPFGAERAGNAAGTIPAWTGGHPADPTYQPGFAAVDPYGDDQPLFTVTAENMAQYADMLSEGQKQMLTKFGSEGYEFVVYPTRRTYMGPQYVYDNTYKNVTRNTIAPQGIVYGFKGAFAGPPFPLIDPADPDAGAKTMWNHLCRWQGSSAILTNPFYVISSDGEIVLTGASKSPTLYPYYDPNGSPDSFGVFFEYTRSFTTAPADQAGEQIVAWESLSPAVVPFEAWLYLVGEGRIRKAPEQSYDSPESLTNGSTNDDETEEFNGAMDRYNWKLVTKKEMIVPYNTYKAFRAPPHALFGKHFVDPSLVRWEVHRVWEVDATLAPGKRHVEPHRIFYHDEDSWAVMMTESYDAQGNFWKFGHSNFEVRPDMPGTVWNGDVYYNLQAEEYVWTAGSMYALPVPFGLPSIYVPTPKTEYDPQAMAGQARF